MTLSGKKNKNLMGERRVRGKKNVTRRRKRHKKGKTRKEETKKSLSATLSSRMKLVLVASSLYGKKTLVYSEPYIGLTMTLKKNESEDLIQV